jgi:hypothetical protein
MDVETGETRLDRTPALEGGSQLFKAGLPGLFGPADPDPESGKS